MDIVLYVNNSEKVALTKALTNMISFSGTLRSQTSVVNPEIIIETGNISGYNYAYIPEFGRYYYITDLISVRENLWSVKLAVDVLMSFRTQILNLSVILSDTENKGKRRYMSGDIWKTNVKEFTTIINFSAGLSENGEFILITAGG